MAAYITIGNSRYYPASWLFSPAASASALADIQKRQSFVSHRRTKLDKTSGGYIEIGGRRILFIVDRRNLQPHDREWAFIGTLATHLVSSFDRLNAAGQAALQHLDSVIFSRSDDPVFRSYADVKPNAFIYDTEEFFDSAGSLITPAYAASNIIHDANHVLLFDNDRPYTGLDAERECWRLQIDNAEALGLAGYEVDYLRTISENPPAYVLARMELHPYANA